MKIVDVLTDRCVTFLDAAEKSAALAELAHLACSIDETLDPETLRKALEHRESLMSTGMGQGVAVPHVRLPEIDRPIMVIGISREGIADYGAMDDQPVHVMVMIAAPAGQHEVYLQLLAQAIEKLRDADTRRRIVDCEHSQEVVDILTH